LIEDDRGVGLFPKPSHGLLQVFSPVGLATGIGFQAGGALLAAG